MGGDNTLLEVARHLTGQAQWACWGKQRLGMYKTSHEGFRFQSDSILK